MNKYKKKITTHIPVLLKECIKYLNIKGKRSYGTYIDCTFGCGGHSKKILENLNYKGKLIALDKDNLSLKYVKKIIDNRLIFYNESFTEINNILFKENINKVDGILIDLGISTAQLMDFSRGFSFKKNGNLDMRFNKKKSITASNWLLKADKNLIFQVIKNYGEEKFAYEITKSIIKFRKNKTIIQTLQLSNIINKTIKKIIKNKFYKNFSKKTFQAIRIYINEELKELKIGLNKLFKKLANNGRLVIISFNSLEDRIIKNFIFSKINSKYKIKIFPKIKPKKYEIIKNSRCKSAILRSIKKINK